MILKNIWKRRKEEIWLFLELVVITIVAWVVFDPAVVNLYYRSLPMGYDAGRLVYGEYITRQDPEPGEDDVVRDEYGNFINMVSQYEMSEKRQDRIIRQFTDVEGVESATLYEGDITYCIIGGTMPGYNSCINERDTTGLSIISFIPNTLFFETYGLRPLPVAPRPRNSRTSQGRKTRWYSRALEPSKFLAQRTWWVATSKSFMISIYMILTR